MKREKIKDCFDKHPDAKILIFRRENDYYTKYLVRRCDVKKDVIYGTLLDLDGNLVHKRCRISTLDSDKWILVQGVSNWKGRRDNQYKVQELPCPGHPERKIWRLTKKY